MGTGEIGVPSLRALADSEHELIGVVTQPDKQVGRRRELQSPLPKVIAEELGLPVFQPTKLRKREAVAEIVALGADLIVVMAYGQILPKAILDAPPVACLNLHASLLPNYRGAAPIQAAILAGDTHTGITVMHMDVGLDTGDVLLMESLKIAADETGGSLHDRLAELAPIALMKALGQLGSGEASRTPQDDSLATHVGKLERDDGRIDWSRPAIEIERMVRAYDPWPGTSCNLVHEDGSAGKRLKILTPTVVTKITTDPKHQPGEIITADKNGILVATGDVDHALLVKRVQPDSKRPMDVSAFLAGRPFGEGARFARVCFWLLSYLGFLIKMGIGITLL